MVHGNMNPVKDLHEKLDFLIKDNIAAEYGGYTCGIKSSFSRKIARMRFNKGIDKKLKNNYRNNIEDAMRVRCIDADTEEIIAKMCRFNEKSDEWQSGTAEAFKAYYDSLHGARPSSDKYFEIERMNEQSIHAAVKVQIFFPANRLSNKTIYDIDIMCQRMILPEVGQTVIINRAFVNANWDVSAFKKTHASRIMDREKYVAANVSDQTAIEIIPFGNDTNPTWELVNNEGRGLGNISLQKICDLYDIEEGLEVAVTLTIIDRDLCIEDIQSEISVLPNDTSENITTSIAGVDGQPLGVNRKIVLQAIAVEAQKSDLPKINQEKYSAVLAQHKVKFIKVLYDNGLAK